MPQTYGRRRDACPSGSRSSCTQGAADDRAPYDSSIRDITSDPARSVERAASALELVNDGIIIVDRSWVIECVNTVASDLVEHAAHDMIGRTFWDVFPDAYDHEFGITYRRAMDSGVEEHLEAYYGPLRGWFDVRAIPTPDGLTFCFQNVNGRRAAAEAQSSLVRAITLLAETTTRDAIDDVLIDALQQMLGIEVASLALVPREHGAVVDLTPLSAQLPVTVGQRALGSLTVAWREPTLLDDQALRVLQLLGNQAAAAIERTNQLARQRAIAETLQQAMLPIELPGVRGAEIAASYVPATSDLSVGGDWYDALVLRDGRLVVAVGDVAGHGVEAAAAMGQVRNALRAYAIEGTSPAEILRKLDVLIDEAGHDLFTTAVVAVFDPSTGVFRWSTAGHLPPILRTSTGARFLHSPVGAPVGVRGPLGFVESEVLLADGDLVLAYTDGLVERRGVPLDDDLERLRVVVSELSTTTADTCEATIAAISGALRADDICVFALRRVSGAS